MSSWVGPMPAWVGAALVLAPLVALLQLVWTASVDVPYLDDYDAVLAFSNRMLDEESPAVRLQLLLAPHNEHRIAVPRAWVLASSRLGGHIDFGVLNLVGCAHLALLLGALFGAFRRDLPPASRLLPFAPAALLVLQPQFASALLWPTTSLSNFGVVAYAALTFLLLSRGSRVAFAAAAAAGVAALFSQGNGLLVPVAGILVPLLAGERRRAAAWSLFALALLGLTLALPGAERAGADLAPNLVRPDRTLRYALNLIGCAGGFSHEAASLLVGAAVLASFALLVRRGLPARNPVLFALLVFLLASVAANALVRAHQGPRVPLAQPRYRFYASVLLAVSFLAWVEVWPRARAARAAWGAALAAAAGFCLLSFRLYGAEVPALSARLTEGLERWWTTGEGGLVHPDFRKASFYLAQSYGRGLLHPTPELVRRHAVQPHPRDLPAAGAAVEHGIDALHHEAGLLLVSGWALAGRTAHRQQVEIVLRSADGAFAAPTYEVLRADLPVEQRSLVRRLARSGFRALVRTDSLPPGTYRIGLLVRRSGGEHLTFLARSLQVE